MRGIARMVAVTGTWKFRNLRHFESPEALRFILCPIDLKGKNRRIEPLKKYPIV